MHLQINLTLTILDYLSAYLDKLLFSHNLHQRILNLTRRYTPNKLSGSIKLFETDEIRNQTFFKFHNKPNASDHEILKYIKNIALKRDRESYPRFQNANYTTEEILEYRSDLFEPEDTFETYHTSLFDALQELGIESKIDLLISEIENL